ncbi:MAG: PBP1A family penicillin-binding protein [Paenibacillaceae bacterium]|nr:PBP1A family penicillin-binding protein [Paenibacillaceae bacterium]
MRRRALISLCALAVLIPFAAVGSCQLVALPPMAMEESTVVVDAEGTPMDTLYRLENRRVLPLTAISPYFIDALIAMEDQRFPYHFGIDVVGIARALYVNAQARSWKQGASTITQQLARNAYLNHERTWTRKIKESIYACALEAQYSKADILTMYANKVYFGYGTYGVEYASRKYFEKSAHDLTLAEAALLAGSVRSWKYYSPYSPGGLTRQRAVLRAMLDQNRITSAQYTNARNAVLRIAPDQRPAQRTSHVRSLIRANAARALSASTQTIDTGGLTIQTTIRPEMQRIAEQVVSQYVHPHIGLQAALVAIDPRSGALCALVGGRPDTPDAYNRALSSTRQPGSAFKPIVYVTALASRSMTATSRYRSAPTVFVYDDGRQTYAPKNYADKYGYADIDMRTALARSDNIYAVHTLLDIGAPRVHDMARRLGIHAPLTAMPSLALGASPVSVLELAGAYAAFASGGTATDPYVIDRITASNGATLFANQKNRVRVLTPEVSYVMTDLLQGVLSEGGTAHRVASLVHRPIAVKTGTTNYDAWAVGYTPELVTAVWVGYDQQKPISPIEAQTALPIFAAFTERALASVPPKPFVAPPGVTTVYIDEKTGLLGDVRCGTMRLESFVASTAPTTSCAPSSKEPTHQEGITNAQRRAWWQNVLRWWNSDG